ncbi:unnamed protein product [Cylicostephanus goldi]|uniref:Uncharacterized protein n=1 Tax=Cylicostephanus goldi TaxID=71465 RepID=A0A3P7M7P1_CYLGO|nr:unnamed protein product [Cylicostephanus goldi]
MKSKMDAELDKFCREFYAKFHTFFIFSVCSHPNLRRKW